MLEESLSNFQAIDEVKEEEEDNDDVFKKPNEVKDHLYHSTVVRSLNSEIAQINGDDDDATPVPSRRSSKKSKRNSQDDVTTNGTEETEVNSVILELRARLHNLT